MTGCRCRTVAGPRLQATDPIAADVPTSSAIGAVASERPSETDRPDGGRGRAAGHNRRMTTYAVIGTGGVGGFYGIHLARTGSEVHFLIRSPIAADDVLRLESTDRSWDVRPGPQCRVHREWRQVPQVDIVIVAVKATANAQVAAKLAGIVKPGGAVVLAQNGIDAEPGFAAALPAGVVVIGGLAFLASHRRSPTRFVHVDYGALTLGRYLPGYQPGGVCPAMDVLAADLGRAEIPVILAEDLLGARWQKLVWNVPFNGLSVLLQARTDELIADEAATSLVVGLMREVVEAAAGDGRILPAQVPESMLAMTRGMKPYAPSMKLDYDLRRPLEIDAMYGAVLARAAANGVAMPRTQLLAAALRFLDARNRAG